MTDIPFLDLKAAYEELSKELDAAASRVLDSGRYVGGAEVIEFEKAFASYSGASFCVGVGNGLDALHLSLLGLGIGPGDEVIVATNTYIATWLAVSMVGATPVPVEPDPATHNLDPRLIPAAITERTKLVLPTHLYGQPANMGAILEIAGRHGLKVVEDAAQAHGARYREQRVGAHSNAVCWSFYPGKNLGAFGDGGAVTTDDPALAERIRMLGNYGSHRKYVNDVRGFNSRLDPLQAAFLHEKLKVLDEWNGRRAAIASLYLDGLADTGLVLPEVPDWAEPAWHLFVVQSPDRDRLAACLAEDGIQTLIHYPVPPHLQKAYGDLGFPEGTFPVAERLAKQVLSLPIGPHLSMGDAARIVKAVRRALT